MAKQEDIGPIYHELQGYLSEAPSYKLRIIDDAALWDHINQTIDELNHISGEDYSRFKMIPKDTGQFKRMHIEINTYRTKLSGLISRLHAKYFPNEPAPLSDMPSTVISQTQQQSQLFLVELLLPIQSKIDEQLHKLEPGDKKRSFLEKAKGALKSVRNAAELIALLLKTGQEFDLTLEELSELFK